MCPQHQYEDLAKTRLRLLEAGWAQHKSNGNENAIAQFNQALALNPSSVEALKGRGICYSEMGEDDLAMQDFHTVGVASTGKRRCLFSSRQYVAKSLIWLVWRFLTIAMR